MEPSVKDKDKDKHKLSMNAHALHDLALFAQVPRCVCVCVGVCALHHLALLAQVPASLPPSLPPQASISLFLRGSSFPPPLALGIFHGAVGFCLGPLPSALPAINFLPTRPYATCPTPSHPLRLLLSHLPLAPLAPCLCMFCMKREG